MRYLPVVLIVSGIVSFFYFVTNSTKQEHPINGRLIARTETPLMEVKKSELENEIQSIIATALSEKKAKRISVYAESLNKNKSLVINGEEKYSPASMVKALVLIAILKQAENNPTLLQKKISSDALKLHGLTQTYAPEESLQDGKQYTVEELTQRMIRYSDNKSYLLLATTFQIINFDPLTDALGMTSRATIYDYMSAQEFAKVYKSLYNAAYLTRKKSDYALDLLSETTFNDGLTAGIPQNIKVAHKFGERETKEATELHDCGIIYYPDHPYILCIMTQGNDVKQLAPIITSISRTTYNYVDKKAQTKQNLTYTIQ